MSVIKTTLNSQLIHLPLSTNYVQHWGIWEAVRELIQNKMDMNRGSVEILDDMVRITTYDEPLLPNTLLLGGSTKQGSKVIGKYGEGYKLACLVLVRMGYNLVIRNGLDSWKFIVTEHPQMKCDCLAVEINYDVYPDTDADSKNTVSFFIKGLSEDDQEELARNYLEPEVIHESFNVVLSHNNNLMFCPWLPEDEEVDEKKDNYVYDVDYEKFHPKPCVYVKGLFVCFLPSNFTYSYSLQPDMVNLDRDRSSVDTWDLGFTLASLMESAGAFDLMIELAEKGAPELHEYYSPSRGSIISDGKQIKVNEKLNELALSNFYYVNGNNAFPVYCNLGHEKKSILFNRAKSLGLNPVEVTKRTYSMLPDNIKKLKGGSEKETSTVRMLRLFMQENKKHLRSKAAKNLERLIEDVVLNS